MTTDTTTTTRRRHGTAVGRAAIDLVAAAYLEHKIEWIASRLDCRVDGGVATITLNGHTVHTGDADTLDRVRAELPTRLAATVDIDDPMFVQCVYLSEHAKRITDFWEQPGRRAVDWLGRSLCADDDVAHCALDIAALVGGPRWQAYVDTSANVRVGTTLPWTPCLVAGARNTRRDLFLQDWDMLVIRDILDRVRQSHGPDGTVYAQRRRQPVVRHGGLCAVEVAPGQWDLSRGPSGKSTGMPPVDVDCMAQMLASARLVTYHHTGVSLHIDGHMWACVEEAGKHVNIALAQTSLDRNVARTRAILSAAALTDDPRKGDFVDMASAVHDAVAIDQGSRHTVAPDSAWLAGLREALHHQESLRMRLWIGGVWDAAIPSVVIECVNESFVADAQGVWRDAFGVVASWDDLMRAAQVKRRLGSSSITLMPHYGRDVNVRLTRDDPCAAPDFAHRLCCDALAGDLYAIDWLGVLALASPQWAMLDATVCGVLTWVRDGALTTAPPSGNSAPWCESLIDWILDMAAGDDASARFAADEDAFNRSALCAIDEAGRRVSDRCMCTGPGSDNIPACCDGMCIWRTHDHIATLPKVSGGPGMKVLYKATYRGAVTRSLTRTALGIDGRQILAADAFCPLLGERGRGVEALVRALHTCEPLRKGIIEPAQLALADRVLTARSAQ
ncbi:hypothetical protein TW95_gp0453 [Pandoravirus inopinatum]|uniref:Uncharacterized protein n=1 Tax=Pandoravirus inopinatum TaxID=1605721 RepID=A0A0B5JC85_9VIRU|nr:hypothetical protein TW95_gp0453 [Pandoravirus inopinatum]AJF97187.1 hypothetical protein [Pandoravirus inopinatum]